MPKTSAHADQKPIAIEMRVAQRLGCKEIHRRTGVRMSTLHHWLRPYPLTKDEQRAIIRSSPRYKAPKKVLAPAGDGLLFTSTRKLDPHALSLLGESATMFGLAQRNLVVSKGGEGDVADFYVRRKGSERLAILQSRCATISRNGNGLPTISLRRFRRGKANTFKPGDFHFIVGFCRENSRCYVYSYGEIKGKKNCVSVSDDGLEAWHKIEEWLDGTAHSVAVAAAADRAPGPRAAVRRRSVTRA